MANRDMPPVRRRTPATRRNAPPAPKDNTRAIKSGAQANPRNLPGYDDRLAALEAMCAADAPWIAPTDRPILAEFAGVLNGLAYTRPWLEEHGYLDRRGVPRAAAKLYLRQVRFAGELADRLGFTPQARVKLGLKAAQTAEVASRQPIRSEARARAVAELLQRSGALPQIEQPADEQDAEVVVVPDPEDPPRPPGRRE